jgi:iron complex transport system substrate-binding protein
MRLMHGYPVACFMAAILALSPANAAPQRVVSTFLCTDEYVFRLVPRAHIAALSFLAADTHPVVSTIQSAVADIPLTRASAEEVLTLRPDLVVMQQGTNPRLKAHLEAAHIPILEIPDANSLADIRRITRDLGRAFGAPDRAAALVGHMDSELAEAARDAEHPPVQTLIYEPNGYANSGTVSDEILRASGIADVSGSFGETRAGTIPVEEIVASPPELLILSGENESTPSRGDLILQHPALRSLSRTTFIARAALTPFLCPGPWSADAAPMLAKLGRDARAR